MATIEVARAAVDDLNRLIAVLSLPADTRDRVKRSLASLAEFPRLGPALPGRWEPARFVLGPWRWMIFVYDYDAAADRVVILTVQDARSSTSATSG